MIYTIATELEIMAKLEKEDERLIAAELILDQLIKLMDLDKRCVVGAV